MIRRIILENYMAHERTVIELAAGLTVLVGPNNCGKSAIVHALEMICYNSDAADFAIRHGAKKAVVTIELEDDDGTPHVITWWRKPNTAGYVIDGREISGLGRGKIPDDLQKHLRMPMIESAAGGREFLLHFGLQKSPIFLLDDPASRAAQFFASATDADKLMQMQKAHQQKSADAKRDKIKLDAVLEQLDRQLAAVAPVTALSQHLAHLEGEHATLMKLAAEIDRMATAVRDIGEIARRESLHAGCAAALAALIRPPALHETQKLADCIESMRRASHDADRSDALGRGLTLLQVPPQLASTLPLQQMCVAIEEAIRYAAAGQLRSDAAAQLAAPPAMHDVAVIATAIRNISSLGQDCDVLIKQSAALAPLRPPPSLAETAPLAEALSALDKSAASVQRLRMKSEALRSLIAAPSLQDPAKLRQKLDEIEESATTCRLLAGRTSALSGFAAPAVPAELQPLIDSIAEIAEAARIESKQRGAVKRMVRETELFQRDLESWVAANPQCEACGQVVSVELITQERTHMGNSSWRGILCIGDPHLCTWAPGYRRDDYPRTLLDKLEWSLTYAKENALLPILLGDLFHVPRDNANWLITHLLRLLRGEILTVIGNHDASEDQLCEQDSLTVLFAADRLVRLDRRPWLGQINGVSVAIGGTNHGQRLPRVVDRAALGSPRWVFWIAHHDILFPGCEKAGYIGCTEIPGADLVVNGHIHRALPDVVRGGTTWCNPGNIARVSRSDACQQHVPGVLRIDIEGDHWTKTRIEIPCQPFDQVFYPVEQLPAGAMGESSFIKGLQSMQKFKTADGEGLRRLIEDNLAVFPNERVKSEIMILMQEVLGNARTSQSADN